MSFVVFLLVALLGAFVQTVTGFALGMILIALAAGLHLVSIPVLTAAVSLLSLTNVCMALRTQYKNIQWDFWRLITLGQLPAIGVGLWVMLYLNDDSALVLQLLLGLFVLLGSLSMMRRNALLSEPSSRPARFAAGVAGGLCGGMFSASGPVMGWFFYRQPLALELIRPTLLACFGMTTSLRTLLVGSQGGIDGEVLGLVGASLPMILLGTWLGGRYADRLSEKLVRRYAFVLLTVMGVVITARACWEIFSG